MARRANKKTAKQRKENRRQNWELHSKARIKAIREAMEAASFPSKEEDIKTVRTVAFWDVLD